MYLAETEGKNVRKKDLFKLPFEIKILSSQLNMTNRNKIIV